MEVDVVANVGSQTAAPNVQWKYKEEETIADYETE